MTNLLERAISTDDADRAANYPAADARVAAVAAAMTPHPAWEADRGT
jgi:hypothetical protein